MKNIKTFFQMITQILREESDGDLMYYLESINTPEEALKVIKTLRNKLVDRGNYELHKEMEKYNFISKENLIGTFATIVEKQRGYPLGMGEYSDIEDWAKAWADDNGYAQLFTEEEPHSYEDELFSYLNHLQFDTYDELCSTIRCRFRDKKNMEIKDDECTEFASDFVDKKELGDISYDDLDDWVENRKDYLFDDLNNILFEKHSELTEYIKGWLTKHKLVDDSAIVGELASEFIDKKELYDLDYDD